MVDLALKRRAKSDARSANNMVVWLLSQALAEEIDQLQKEKAVATAAEDDVDWSSV